MSGERMLLSYLNCRQSNSKERDVKNLLTLSSQEKYMLCYNECFDLGTCGDDHSLCGLNYGTFVSIILILIHFFSKFISKYLYI